MAKATKKTGKKTSPKTSKPGAAGKVGKASKAPRVDTGALDDAIAKARAAAKDLEWEALIAVLQPLEAAAKQAPAAIQVPFWELLLEAYELEDTRKAPAVARALAECDPKAPVAVRATRLAKQAVAENDHKKADGYKTFQAALQLAPDDNTRANVLLLWSGVEHDQLSPITAVLDAAALANAGKLSADTALDVWDHAVTGLRTASSQKSVKAQQKLFAARGFDSRDAAKVDAGNRYVSALKSMTPRSPAVVSSYVTALFDQGAFDEGLRLFDRWTPKVVELHKKGKITDYDLYDSWFAVHYSLSLNGREKDAERIQKQRTKLRGY